MSTEKTPTPQAHKVETTITKVDPGAMADAPAGESCLIVFYGSTLGRRYFLNRPELMIGRSEAANIQVDQDSISRLHAKVFIGVDQRPRVVDLESTNGTFVNNIRITEHILSDGDMVRVGQTIFKYLSGNNIENKYHEEIYRLTTIDGLTEVYNKRFFLDAIERELNRAARYQRLISLVMFDIDHFKKINDTHGHLAGDAVLRELAQLIGQNLRRQDILARYGGEEFAIILPEVDADGASLVCEKLRMMCERHTFFYNGLSLRITISLGINAFVGQSDSTEAFIEVADKKLYVAKERGRNCVVV